MFVGVIHKNFDEAFWTNSMQHAIALYQLMKSFVNHDKKVDTFHNIFCRRATIMTIKRRSNIKYFYTERHVFFNCVKRVLMSTENKSIKSYGLTKTNQNLQFYLMSFFEIKCEKRIKEL